MSVRMWGVPTAAGAYGGGVARGPAALRSAGFIAELVSAGVNVEDRGDLPPEPFASDPAHPRRQNLERVMRVARNVADRVEAAVLADTVPLLVGGDCTITLGVLAGMVRTRPRIALAYIDGDADLSTPSTTRSGILDAMGVATMLGLDGAPPELAGLAGSTPLIGGERLALVGYDGAEVGPAEQAALQERGVRLCPATSMGDDPAAAVTRTLARLEDRDGLVVHFDVDVIDSTELPLAQYPHFNAGLTLDAAMAALASACEQDDVKALVITELNPDNDASGEYVRRLARALAGALASLGSR